MDMNDNKYFFNDFKFYDNIQVLILPIFTLRV